MIEEMLRAQRDGLPLPMDVLTLRTSMPVVAEVYEHQRKKGHRMLVLWEEAYQAIPSAVRSQLEQAGQELTEAERALLDVEEQILAHEGRRPTKTKDVHKWAAARAPLEDARIAFRDIVLDTSVTYAELAREALACMRDYLQANAAPEANERFKAAEEEYQRLRRQAASILGEAAVYRESIGTMLDELDVGRNQRAIDLFRG